MPAVWTEWCTTDSGCPTPYRGYGSPTILVNGVDIAPDPRPWGPQDTGDGPRCRTYMGERGRLEGTPPVELVTRAILEAVEPDAV
ncbi:MAG: hypothetical protein OEZ65_02650 [Gemmatimonadota bacterium]|nr:hypothetical protein [Gemmatimonadota bacterium]MDH5758462.1 hypothetical protein [Gemmatimonadota bacterium]